jgi:hypothetical protein
MMLENKIKNKLLCANLVYTRQVWTMFLYGIEASG